ncbi:CoA-transferase [Staphylococcus coagulans]|uniref:fatty acid degradation protein FadX n=1 Tax=Staphylococcus coagulans TaxID=74706 RepID=UPI001BEA77BC|nr:CoA-transferase [Staphylococcus coagulans]MBT2810151.1 acyl CoA:acetate/3-ketoacid CoA transferase [Staphylococcus coagulans]MBT2812006.1 acyl CoA:acetate/3-ketoacid CoA transferase [Staphylococcus coagulans]MBT2819849.1 acyl CoA:acetate/3-ketoacid CoA transferase [Staphylococcus coagulans]MBT2821668.1 acyl CoA:acetate/3-ketoacid CoA transferase [Staphylococcus coagulans]MBT2823856.1 acyl CoA:acetate/3-ketoacid CoA transferase [Staphylococcus coagulans]
MKQCTLETFKTLIHDGDVIGLAALTVSNLPTALLYGLAEQYDETASPAHLTFMLANDISTGGHTIDLDHFIQRNMVDRIIMSIMTASPLTAQAIQSNQVEAYFLPQGVIATHYRQTNHLTPGIITKIGLHTHIDPRYKGGKANEKTQESLVSLINIEGEEFLHYHLPAVNIALLRGTYADEKGNIYMDEEAHLGESYSVALNAKAHHGTVVVQVKAIVDSNQQNPNHVFIPGSLVDYIYVVEDIAYHRQLIQTQYSPALSGQMRVESLPEPPLPFSIRKLILRRAAQFLTTGDTISIGFGINNELTNLLHEERVEHLVQPIMDIGIFGGFIGSRDYYGMNFNVDARMRHDLTWDFIYNSGISIAFMSFAEVDQYGHVNVSYFGHRMNGCGGFIDISQSVQKIVFSGTLVARGQLSVSNQALHVEQQGQTQKFVSNVSNIDFNADYAKSLQQEIYYVTERAVFQLTQDGLMLIEIAPGLDIERDVIAQMGFRPLVSKNLKTIDTSIYHHVWGALLDRIQTEA